MATLTNGKDTLDKETFIDLVKDAGGWSDFLYGIYQKLLRVTQDHLKLKEQVHQLESTMEATVDDWVTDALKNTPKDDEEEESAPRYFKNRKGALVPEYQGEQMLGDRSPYGCSIRTASHGTLSTGSATGSRTPARPRGSSIPLIPRCFRTASRAPSTATPSSRRTGTGCGSRPASPRPSPRSWAWTHGATWMA